MDTKSAFFGIVNFSAFENLEFYEKQIFLIEKAIYVEDKSFNYEIEFSEFYNNEYESNVIEFLCPTLEVNNKTYFLNNLFLDEVFEKILQTYKYYSLPTLTRLKIEREMVLEVFLSSKDKSRYIEEMHKSATQEYLTSLSHPMIKELHSNRSLDEKQLFQILEKHLIYCKKDLSHYIFGLDNIKSSTIIHNYYSFKRLNDIFDFCSLNMELTPETNKHRKAASLPRVIAILNEIGFFEMPFIKNLSTDNERYKVIAMLLRDEFDSSNFIREIRGNVYSLNEYKSVNRNRYTAMSHKEEVKRTLSRLK